MNFEAVNSAAELMTPLSELTKRKCIKLDKIEMVLVSISRLTYIDS